MFIALDGNNNRINILDAQKNTPYFCPICKAPLIIKDGKIYTKHFAHMIGSPCYDNWSHDMSEWHLNWQQRFPEGNREVVVSNNNQVHRADVLIDNTVIEFQHSKITKEEINERNQFYTSCGYKVVWVFDATDKIKNCYKNSDIAINPLDCGIYDLCWKRKNDQYDFKYRDKACRYFGDITIYLQYKYNDENILIKLQSISSKKFEFYKTFEQIREQNFVSNFIPMKGVKSSETIIQEAISYFMKKWNIPQVRPTYIFPIAKPKKRRWWL